MPLQRGARFLYIVYGELNNVDMNKSNWPRHFQISMLAVVLTHQHDLHARLVSTDSLSSTNLELVILENLKDMKPINMILINLVPDCKKWVLSTLIKFVPDSILYALWWISTQHLHSTLLRNCSVKCTRQKSIRCQKILYDFIPSKYEI